MTEKIIRIPDRLTEPETIAWMIKAFHKIIDFCEIKKIKKAEFIVDYGGKIRINGRMIPCQKTWTLKDIKNWIKLQEGK